MQKPGLHLDPGGAPQTGVPATAPPNLQPFFDEPPDAANQSNVISASLKVRAAPPLAPVAVVLPPLR